MNIALRKPSRSGTRCQPFDVVNDYVFEATGDSFGSGITSCLRCFSFFYQFTEGVSYINAFPVGETSRSRFLPLPAILHFPRITGPVLRERSMARDRPSPYVKGRRFFTAARGPRMPHAHPSGFHRAVERFMNPLSLFYQFTRPLVF